MLAKELYLEAEFYQIAGIQKEIWPGGTFQNSGYIINSLNDEQRTALLSLLPHRMFLLIGCNFTAATLMDGAHLIFINIVTTRVLHLVLPDLVIIFLEGTLRFHGIQVITDIILNLCLNFLE